MSKAIHIKDLPTTTPGWMIRVEVGHTSRAGYHLTAYAVQTVNGLENIPLHTFTCEPLERSIRVSQKRILELQEQHAFSSQTLKVAQACATKAKLTLAAHEKSLA